MKRIVGLVIAMMALCPALAAAQTPLRILLTSDDGWASAGVQEMKAALEADGHLVTVVAPEIGVGGSSASLSVSGPVAVTEQSTGVYSVAGTAATSVLIGMTMMGTPPDLVISGINDSYSGGPLIIHSGTIGAALTGVSRGIPAIAVMTTPPSDSSTAAAHLTDVAAFVVRLVDALRADARPGDAILPKGIGLKVGYPGLSPADIQGVTLATEGDSGLFDIGYREYAPGLFVPQITPTAPARGDARGDVTRFMEGFITVVPLQTDLTAAVGNRARLHRMLHRLQP